MGLKNRAFIVLLSLLSSLFGYAQSEVGVAFYDVGRLYDTIPSSFYDDSDYTPSGRAGWNDVRYNHKVRQIAKVIDSLRMPIVVLFGVESEAVVRDVQRESKLEYSALHRTLDYYDGLDFALLYYGDMLYVDRVESNNYYTYIGGELRGGSFGLHLTRRGDRLRTLLPLGEDEMSDISIVWGRLTARDLDRLGVQDLLRDDERSGRGDTKGGRGWYLKSRIGVRCGDGVEVVRSGIYISRYLLNSGGDAPLPTHSSTGYVGGYSSHLPTYVVLSQ